MPSPSADLKFVLSILKFLSMHKFLKYSQNIATIYRINTDMDHLVDVYLKSITIIMQSKTQADDLVGTHPMLNWTLFEIKGKFIHGNLEGRVRILTTNNNVIFAFFKNGDMHGPVFAYDLSLLSYKHYESKGFLLKTTLQMF